MVFFDEFARRAGLGILDVVLDVAIQEQRQRAQVSGFFRDDVADEGGVHLEYPGQIAHQFNVKGLAGNDAQFRGKQAQPFIDDLAPGDVLHRADHARRLAGLVVMDFAAILQPAQCAPRLAVTEFGDVSGVIPDRLFECRLDFFLVGRVYLFPERFQTGLGIFHPEQTEDIGRPEQLTGVQIEIPHTHVRGIERHVQALFALTQRSSCLL